MRLERALLVRRAISNHGPYRDERRAVLDLPGRLNGELDCVRVVAIVDLEDVPAVGSMARHDIFGERDRCGRRQRDVVVVVENNEAAETEVPGE